MSSISSDDGSGKIATAPRRLVAWLSVIVLVAGLVLTGALAWGASDIHQRNEDRLLNLELRQAASVVTAAVPSIQIPLVSAAELADATNGSREAFQKYIGAFVGPAAQFVSASLWHISSGIPAESTSVGSPPATPTNPSTLDGFVSIARRSSPFAVLNLLASPQPSIAYAASAGPTSAWVVVADSVVPKNKTLSVTKNSAFSQLNYAIYLGASARPADLLGATSRGGTAGANSATVTVAFGNSSITLVGTPNGELGGTLLSASTSHRRPGRCRPGPHGWNRHRISGQAANSGGVARG